MPEPNSPFYPPRAPWYAPAREVGHSALAATRLHRIATPNQIGLGKCLLSLILPGYAFSVHGRPAIGRCLIAAWFTCFFLGIVFLGDLFASAFFSLAISIHATSVVHLIYPWLKEASPSLRLAGSAASVAGLILVAYLPLQSFCHAFLFLPVQVGPELIVLQPSTVPTRIQRGDWVAYQMDSAQNGSVHFQEGLSLGPVLGLPGDTIEFTPKFIRVKDRELPRHPDMPVEGSVTVPPLHWFIWPRLANRRNFNVADDVIRAAILERALVQQSEFRGRPFTRWFHRTQILETP